MITQPYLSLLPDIVETYETYSSIIHKLFIISSLSCIYLLTLVITTEKNDSFFLIITKGTNLKIITDTK